MFDEIANELKTAREKNSLTLVQVANKSKIDIKFLEAIEQGDFTFLPDLYVRAFVKNFAKTVGLDENIIHKKFEAARQGIPYVEEEPAYREILRNVREANNSDSSIPPPKTKSPAKKEAEEIKKNPPIISFNAVTSNKTKEDNDDASKRRNLFLSTILLGIALIFMLIYFLFIADNNQIIVTEKPIEDVIGQNKRYEEESPQNQLSSDVAASSDSLILKVNTSDTSWIRVIVDENSNEEFLLLPNSHKIIKAQLNFELTFGNPQVVKLKLNDNPLFLTGNLSAPKTVKINKDGLSYLERSSSQR